MTEARMATADQFTPLVRRITAPNGSKMTGPGTNTYLLGRDEVTVLDPGPVYPSHLDAILAAGEGRIRRIVVTHTHKDHSPLAEQLAARTGAELIGALMEDPDGFQDPTFHPARSLGPGELLKTEEFTLRAVYTPGHVGNHYCFLLEEDGLLFSGDHIMEGSTVVIIPPSGDMKDYLDSLALLKTLPIKAIAPGHGNLIEEPMALIDALIRHRHFREQKVVTGMKKIGEASLLDMLPVVYDDVDKAVLIYARYSLWAHLCKLERDGVARKTATADEFDQERWTLV